MGFVFRSSLGIERGDIVAALVDGLVVMGSIP